MSNVPAVQLADSALIVVKTVPKCLLHNRNDILKKELNLIKNYVCYLGYDMTRNI